MAAISSSVGLISGINTGAIITALIHADSIPVSQLQTRINTDQTINSSYQDLGSQLGTLQTTVQSLEQPSAFQAATATSSDQSVLTATAASGAALGNYSLQVAQLVSTQQLISTGFSDTSQTPVGAGTITIEQGGGNLATQTPLSELNGGAGVGRGQFRITDRSGASAVIDTTSAVTLDDVVNDINNASTVSVRASIQKNHLVLTDTSGSTASNFIVQDLGNGTSATDLGIAQNTPAGGNAISADINYISSTTQLGQLNDGRGVGLGTGGGDLKINLRDGSSFSVNLATAKTVGQVLTAINTASGGKLTASIPDPQGSAGIQLQDNTGGAGTLSVASINGSSAAADLGLTANSSGDTLTGKDVIASLDSTLLSSLKGGSGLSLGRISFTDSSGASETLNFSADTSVQSVLDTINNASGVSLHASLKSSGNGIQITDESGGTGNITIADVGGGNSAEQLGINGSSSALTVQGADLQKQYVTNNTLLSSLNGGKGIDKSQFTITNSKGVISTIDLTGTNITTVGDLLYQINSKPKVGVTASINAAGNGILLTDTAGGAGKLKVADKTGTAASDLNIASTATGTTINGAYEKTITVTANDTLATVEKEINNLNFGVQATIINDGSSVAPYRLSLTSLNSGKAGAVTFDAGTTNLGTQTLVQGQDAAVFVGSSSTTSQPLLITSSTNQITNVIQGVTLSLNSVSKDPVQLSISQDTSGIVKSLNTFVSTFNNIVSGIASQSSFNTTTNVGGLLLGDPVASSIQSALYSSIESSTVTGTYRNLTQLGITVGQGGQLSFNQDTFTQALATDPTGVENLLNATSTVTNANHSTSTVETGLAYTIDKALTQLIAPVDGSVSSAENELTQESQGFQDQITQLNSLLSQKQAVLQEQFANMESVLASLQSQQSALGSITNISSSSSSTSKTTG